MEEYKAIKEKAENYRKSKKYIQAIPLYEQMWINYRQQCDKWDGWAYAYCLKQQKRYEEALGISREIYKDNRDFDHIKSIYVWCVYYVKIKIEEIKNETEFLKAANFITKETKQEDKFSPYTLTVFKVLEYYNNKPSYDPEKIIQWTDKLNPGILDTDSFRFKDETGKERELASKKEKWYSLRSKALLEDKSFNECIKLSEEGLKSISKFHYSDDIWLKRNIALSKAGLEKTDEALNELKSILLIKKEWFIQYEIAELLVKQDKTEEAMIFAISAALNSGDIKLKIKLFKLIAELLIKKNLKNEAKMHYEFIYQIKKFNNWKIDTELINLLKNQQIDVNKIQDITQLKKDIKQIWEKLKYEEKTVHNGVIRTILPNGKAGFVEAVNKTSYYFSVKEFKGKKEILKKGQKVSFYVEDSFDIKRNKSTKIATNIKPILNK